MTSDPIHRPAHLPGDQLLAGHGRTLTDRELLAALLRCGQPGRSATDLAQSVLAELGGLAPLARTSARRLLRLPGLGPARAAQLLAAAELGRRVREAPLQRRQALTRPSDAGNWLSDHMMGHLREVFACLFLDNRHRLIAYEELFFGTIDGAAVYPREVVRRCLEHNAAAVILCHNHPSGVAEPSEADRTITRRLSDALQLVDVRVLDHLVLGERQWTSLAERGWLG